MDELELQRISNMYNEMNGNKEEYRTPPKVYDPGYYTPMISNAERQREKSDNEWKAAKAFYNGFVVEGGRGLLNATLMLRETGLKQLKEENPEYEETKATGEFLNTALNSSAMQRYNVKADSQLGQLALDLTSGAGQLAAQMGVTYATGGWGGAAFMGAQISGNQYEVLRKSGVSVERASQAAITNGIVQGIMEKAGLEKVMKALPANSPLKKKILGYVESFLSEGMTEGMQGLPEQLTEIWAKNEGITAQEIAKKWDENSSENLKSMGYDALIGGLLGVGGRAVNNTVNTAVEQIGKKVHEHRVNQLEQRIETAKKEGVPPEEIAFKTNESLPDDYVFVDADMLQTFMQTKNSQEVAETLGITEQEVNDAVELGNDVTVHQGNYEAAAVKYSDMHNSLKEGISFGGADESVNNTKLKEELRKEYQDLDAENKNQLNAEIDKIMKSAEVAGVNESAREGLRSLLLSRAMIWDADHPVNFFKEHPLTFSNQGAANNGKGMYYQTAYHGSPYNFDKFNLQAIGTGEGAIAHGWGLYFALDDEVAQGYKEKLAEVNKNPIQYKVGNSSITLNYGADTAVVNGETITDENIVEALGDLAFYNKPNSGKKVSLKDELAKAEKYAAVWAEDATKTDAAGVHRQAKMLARIVEGLKKLLAHGEEIEISQEALNPTIYKVDVPELDTMLDEEGYFDEQPQIVQDAVLDILDFDVSDLNGRQIYKKLVKQLGSKKAASIALKERGVQGIYYDGRQDGDCVVVFDDEAIKILDTYQQATEAETKGAIQFDKDGAAIINLFKGADASTVIHETGHYFVEAMARDIENGIANEQQIKDFEALLKYSDLDMERWKAIREKLKDSNLSDDDRRDLQAEVTKVHERLAEAFESYLIEGKAPKRELRNVFKRFGKWLRAVYSSVRKNAQGEEVREYDESNRNPNAVALTKEVTEVFDRWLAAEEDIAAQEAIEGWWAQIPESARNFLSERSQEQIKDYIAKAHDKAVELLTKKYMENFGKERAAKIAAFKKGARKRAEKAVNEKPLYKAMSMLAEYTEVGKQAPKTLARKYLRSLNNDALNRKEELADIKADINERLEPIIEALEAGIGDERTYWVDKETNAEVDVSDLEKSKSEELKTRRFYDNVTEDTSTDWYINYKQKYGKRKPSKKKLREIAYEIYTGNDEFGLYAADFAQLSAEEIEAINQETAQNKAEIDELMERQKWLEHVAEVRKPWGWDKADLRFTLSQSDRLSFDMVAQECGYQTGEELAKAIQNGDTFGQAVQKELQSMVDKIYPDYYKEAELRKDEIRKALYNDKTGQVIALEQQLIEDYVAGVGKRQRTNEENAKLAKARRQAIKNIALDKISRMSMRQLQNIRGFIRAERNAAAEAQRAIQNGDMETAAMWKETQAVNHAIVVEAVKIKNQTKANVRTIARIRRMKKELFGTEQHFNQVAAMLERMGERVRRKDYDATTKTQSLTEYVAEMSERYDNVDIADWLLDETIDLSDARDMSYEQYTDVINALKNLVAISRNERKQSMLDKERTHQETVAEVMDRLNELDDKYTPGPNGKDDRSSPKYWLDRAVASLRNTDNLFELMDNWTYGYFSKTWGTALKRCADLEAELTMQMEADFREAYAEWIEANPDRKGNDEDVYYEELGTVANKATLIKILINLGNEGNSRILCSTPPIDMRNSTLWIMPDDSISPDAAVAQTRANLIRFLGEHLTASDMKFAQKQVDIANRNWPALADLERRTKGFTPKKVEASPVSLTLADGTTEVFKGGYYPLVRDSREGSRPANMDVFDIGGDIPAANVKTMHTNTGASKARTKANYPISLAADSGMRSIRDVIHDIAYRETMADFRKLLNDKDVMPLLKRKLGMATTEQLGEMLVKTANPTGSRLAMAEDFYASAANWIRRKTVNAAIMLNLKTAFQNLGNITLYGRAVEGFGYDDTMRAVFGRGFLQAADWRGNNELDALCSKSVFMRERVLFPDYTIKEIMGEENLTPVQRKTMKWGAMVLAYTDNLTAKPVWAEAYRKKIAEGATEQEAVDFADTVIRRVLGSNRTQDVSSFMRGGPIYKLFTSFQGFFNTQFNQWEREANIASNYWKAGERAKFAERITAFAASKWLLNCMLALILGLENPFEKDEKDGYRNLTKEMMHYPLSMCGPIGQATNMFMDNAFGISSYRFRLSAIESTLDKGGKFARTINKVAQGKAEVQDLAEPAMGVVLPLAFDVPDQVNKLLWNAYDVLFNGMSPQASDLIKRRPKNERKEKKDK